MTPPGDELAQRIGDRDRDRAAEELRLHQLEGRLDAEELEDRLGGAYRARTLGDLSAVLADLPERARRGIVPTAPAPTKPPPAGGFGLLSFSIAHDLPVSPEEAYGEALNSIGQAMTRYGYELTERVDGQALVFERHERPGWVPLVCVAAFPIGLFALTVKRTTRVRVEVLPRPGGGSRLRMSGEARRAVRKAFANLMA